MPTIDLEKGPLAEGSSPERGMVVEVSLLLESWLLTALQEQASEQEMTAGELARRLLRDFLYYSDGSVPASRPASVPGPRSHRNAASRRQAQSVRDG